MWFLLAISTTSLAVLVYFILHVIQSTKKTIADASTIIPGPPLEDKKVGNLAIENVGLLGTFAAKLHDQYGPIVGFYVGECFMVSIANVELFAAVNGMFDRPAIIHDNVMDVLTKDSFEFANGVDGKRRHAIYTKNFSSVSKYFNATVECTTEICSILKGSEGTQVNLKDLIFPAGDLLTAKTIFGGHVTQTEVTTFFRLLNEWFSMRVGSDVDAIKNEIRTRKLQELQKISTDALNRFWGLGISSSNGNIMETIANDKLLTDEEKVADLTTIFLGGITTKYLLIRALYFVASDKTVQESIERELADVIGGRHLQPVDIGKLRFLHNVIQETLRFGKVSSFAARVSDKTIKLGQYSIPPRTPIIQCILAISKNSDYFKNANSFDVEHFSDTSISRRPALAFKPFGFAGGRICPAHKFVQQVAAICLTTILGQFKVEIGAMTPILPDKQVDIPVDQIHMIFRKRNHPFVMSPVLD